MDRSPIGDYRGKAGVLLPTSLLGWRDELIVFGIFSIRNLSSDDTWLSYIIQIILYKTSFLLLRYGKKSDHKILSLLLG